MERLRARARRESAPASTEHDFDGCPMCIAERSGRPLSVRDFMPRPDGGPPPIYDGADAYLVAEARKALAEDDLGPGESLPFITLGVPGADGALEAATFSVDSEGRIYWTSPTRHILVTQIPSSRS